MKLTNDTLTNFVANLAAGNAKSVHDQFSMRALNDVEIEAMYRGDWIARKVIDLPVIDQLRPWRSWQADNKQIEAIEGAEKRHKVRAKLAQAMTWARLYGGSAIIIGAGRLDAANGPLAALRPLTPDQVGRGGLRYLTVLPRRMITPGERDLDPLSPDYGEPLYYRMSSPVAGNVDVHPSRVIRFIGAPRPDIDTNPDGWGDSVLQVVYDAVHNAALTSTGIAELVHEAKVDVIKTKGLGAMLSTDEGTKILTKRFQNAAMLKGINGTLLLDMEDEHSRVTQSFAGLPDVLTAFLQVVAGAADMPVTRLLGTSPKGMNATGESDLINYYDMIDGMRETDLRPSIELLDEYLWRDALGSKPEEAFFSFNPLWQLSEKDKAAVDKTRAETDQIYANMGMLPEEALAKGIANRLIENETYPGFEAEIEEYLASNKELVPDDPLLEAEIEATRAKVRSGGNDPGQKPAAKKPRVAADHAVDSGRDILARFSDDLDRIYPGLGSERAN